MCGLWFEKFLYGHYLESTCAVLGMGFYRLAGGATDRTLRFVSAGSEGVFFKIVRDITVLTILFKANGFTFSFLEEGSFLSLLLLFEVLVFFYFDCV